MDAVNVSAGNYVTLGQDLGTLGTVPFEAEEAPHLHLITTMNKETVGPAEGDEQDQGLIKRNK